jgi:hypothetical protein
MDKHPIAAERPQPPEDKPRQVEVAANPAPQSGVQTGAGPTPPTRMQAAQFTDWASI